jgi:hypothetical protein
MFRPIWASSGVKICSGETAATACMDPQVRMCVVLLLVLRYMSRAFYTYAPYHKVKQGVTQYALLTAARVRE